MRTVLLVFVLFSLFVGSLTIRPKLLDQKVRFVNATTGGEYSELVVLQMEFDQDLYLARESFLCGRAEQECPPSDCIPCDWSSQQPTGCDDVKCCGPAQVGGKVFDQVKEWCESSTPYHSLSLGKKSPVVDTQALETVFFRFFVPEEAYCQPFQIFIRPFYGAPTFSLSNLYAFPDQQTGSWFKGSLPPISFRFIQNSFVVCPSLHADYSLGTYSLAVTSFYSASFYVEILLSPQNYPLQPPPRRISCDDVPEEEKNGRTCLQDTESFEILVPNRNPNYDFVLPVPSGCHQVSFAGNGETSDQSTWVYCIPRDTSSSPIFANAFLESQTKGDNRLSFPICSTSTSYVRCAASVYFPSPRSIIFSTVALPHLTPLIPRPGSIPSFGMTYQEGFQAMSLGVLGTTKSTCWPTECKLTIVPPLSDPLIHWPPRMTILSDTHSTDLYGLYYNETNVHLLKKTLVGVIPLTVEKVVYFDRSELDDFSVILSYITNELGEPPLLPNNGLDFSNKTHKASSSTYLPTISFSSFTLDHGPLCNKTNYDSLNDLVKLELARVQNTSSLNFLQFHKYSLDVLQTQNAVTSCTVAALEVMRIHPENVTFEGQIFCQYDEGTTEWEEDACCNSNLEEVACCLPISIEREKEQFSPVDSSSSMCGVPECADTYFEDFAVSFNLKNELLEGGCSAGINDPENQFAIVLDRELEKVIRVCLREVGFQDNFKGIDCAADIHCGQWSGRCNPQTKRCDIGTTQEVEDAFLRCYVHKMSPSLEDYLRVHVLPPEITSEPRDSEAYFQALKTAATEVDCLVLDEPLNISLRSRYSYQSSIACQAQELGLPPDDENGVRTLCHSVHCLGTSCKQRVASCMAKCWSTYHLLPSSEEECSSAPTVCPVTGLPDDVECGGSHCVYCPGKDEGDCQYVAGDQNFCENTVACELVGGSVIFGLNEAECEAQAGFCSVDCPGESCRSLDRLNGACFAATSAVHSESACEELQNSFPGVTAIWYEDSICVILSHSSSSTCAELSSVISPPLTWETCESLPTTSCDGSDAYQRYLKCFIDLWRPCTTQEECENSGHCTDRSWTTIVRSDEHPVHVQFGACFLNEVCRGDLPPEIPLVGCQSRIVEKPADCVDKDDDDSSLQMWLTPAMNEMECLNRNSSARYGCQLPGIEERLLWMGDEDCECHDGVSKYAWDWTDGVWAKHGVSRTLQWKEVQPIQKYKWVPALSIDLLQRWLETNEEMKFSYALKSEVTCESVTVSSFLDTLVCDCFSNSSDSGCYFSETATFDQVETEVGFTSACTLEESFVKSPSSRVSFTKGSITESCTLVNLSFVKEAWFVVPPHRPSISFEFEEKHSHGIVLNQKSAFVGILRGDGSILSFSALEKVNYFFICLLISENQTDTSSYPIKDFGFSEGPIQSICPLGLKNVTLETFLGSEFWCGTVHVSEIPKRGKDKNKIRLYPIQRVEDYENKENDYTSQQTRALMYTLGVCYCICFMLLSAYLVLFVVYLPKLMMVGIISFLFIILCIFRVVFMFGYPNALFDGKELAEFVVFEIPTFLLFSVVIISIWNWKQLPSNPSFGGGKVSMFRVVTLGLIFVWALWLVVTIVYSEVILKVGGDSACPGRVAPSYDKQKEDTRTLAIVYQSLIIFVTFILGAIFCYYSYKLINISKNISLANRVVIGIGGIIVLSFFVRCLLFIIILAVEFTSSIYMFLTLMITEVFLLLFLVLQFIDSFFGGSLFGGTSTDIVISETDFSTFHGLTKSVSGSN